MRVLVSTFPGKGHFHPIAPLALELQSRGHDVLVATGDDLVGWVRSCGLQARPAGLRERDAVRRAQGDLPPGVPFGPYIFARTAAPPMLADLRRIAVQWRPDLVLHEEAEYAAPLLAAELDVPCITHGWPAPTMPTSARDRTTEWLQVLWNEAGRGAPLMVGDRYLDACPTGLQTADINAVPNVLPVRPVLFDGPPTSAGHGWAALPRPLIYLTLGTVAGFARAETLARAADAASRHGGSVLVTTGPVAPIELGPLPANVHVETYVPQRQALVRADVVVSHGGAGSTLGALLYALPHLVLPQGAPSQQRCGERIAHLGAGITLAPDEQSVANISQGVKRLIDDTSYRRAARRVLADVAAVPDVATVTTQVLGDLGLAPPLALLGDCR